VRVPHPVRTLSRGLIEVAAHCPHRGPVLRGRIILSRRLTCPRSEVLGHSAARPRGSHIVRCMVAETHSPPYGLADTAGHTACGRGTEAHSPIQRHSPGPPPPNAAA